MVNSLATTNGQLLFLIAHLLYVCSQANGERQHSYPTLASSGEFVNRWIEEELPRPTQAKCLILIGRQNSGKYRAEEVGRSQSHLNFLDIIMIILILFNNNNKNQRKNSLCFISSENAQLL
jgi:hypothetical protein